MSVDYRHDYIEAYALGGYQQVYSMDRAGILLNGFRFTENAASLSYNLYQFDQWGNVWSVAHYNLYSSWHTGNPTDPDRMIADLNAMAPGRVFALVSYDEPNLGHKQQYNGSPAINQALLDAVYRVGGTAEKYGKDFNYRCAYLLIGKVGEPAYFEEQKGEKVILDPANPDNTNTWGDPAAGLYCAFSVVNNKIVPYKYQNKISAKINALWKEGQAFYYKQLGKWKRIRRVYLKEQGVWKKIYVRNHFEAYSMGLRQNMVGQELRGLIVNNLAVNPTARSYGLYAFNDDGTYLTNHSYDIFGDGVDHYNAIAFINHLNSLPVGQLFLVVTFDEPSKDQLWGDIPAAMYRIGATEAIFGQPFNYRGAYMLAGKVGQPAYFEYYVGDSVAPGDGDNGGALDALIYYSFTIRNNEIIQIPDKVV